MVPDIVSKSKSSLPLGGWSLDSRFGLILSVRKGAVPFESMMFYLCYKVAAPYSRNAGNRQPANAQEWKIVKTLQQTVSLGSLYVLSRASTSFQ